MKRRARRVPVTENILHEVRFEAQLVDGKTGVYGRAYGYEGERIREDSRRLSASPLM